MRQSREHSSGKLAVTEPRLHSRTARDGAAAAADDAAITFQDVLEQASKRDFHLDTFALRARVFAPPRSVHVRLHTLSPMGDCAVAY